MASWIEGIVQSTGVFGIAFLMLLENLFPPIPSELIMPLAGYIAAQGQANIVLIIVAGTIGSSNQSSALSMSWRLSVTQRP